MKQALAPEERGRQNCQRWCCWRWDALDVFKRTAPHPGTPFSPSMHPQVSLRLSAGVGGPRPPPAQEPHLPEGTALSLCLSAPQPHCARVPLCHAGSAPPSRVAEGPSERTAPRRGRTKGSGPDSLCRERRGWERQVPCGAGRGRKAGGGQGPASVGPRQQGGERRPAITTQAGY